jgi:hypothetical protein
MPKKKLTRRKSATKHRKSVVAKKAMRARRPARNKSRGKARPKSGPASSASAILLRQKGTGVEAAGQSGDIQGLSAVARANSESVEELAEEGQSFEAEAVNGVEEAADADKSEVTTGEVLEDDVPSEYDGDR